MQHRVIYNILTDSDRHLRSKIAELVFKRVKSQLLKRALCCCSTLELNYFFISRALSSIDISSINGKTLLSKYLQNLNTVRGLLGIRGDEEVSNILSSDDLRRVLRRLCLFCLKEDVVSELVWVNNSYFRLCSDCLDTCTKRGLVCPGGISYYKVDSKNEEFHRLVKNLVEAMNLLAHLNVIEVLSRLDESERVFLRGELFKGTSGQHPFDYVCVDDYGNKYMVDVTSVKGEGRIPAKLSKRESQIAKRAKRRGFKVLVPVVRFLNNWQVQVELIEV
jgi:hypothetical protein